MSNEIAPFWMVYGIGQGAPARQHRTEPEAVREATRLARSHPGVTFCVLASVVAVTKNDVTVQRINAPPSSPSYDDGIPF